VKTNPNTLLCRFYGLHRVKLPHGKKIHFVVMGNVFPPNKDIHEKWDLKGSLIGREASEEDIKNKPGVVLKDVNWMNMKKKLKLGPQKAKIMLDQLDKDVNLLMDLNIMDYSLLVGVHYLQRGNSENIRENLLSVFEVHLSLSYSLA
jgi:1-phosphatidylinositol-4-phosphate 5-kinase